MASLKSSNPLKLILFVNLFINHLAAIVTVSSQSFQPITEGLNFRAYYRVKAFAKAQPLSVSDVYENYHATLATGLIRHTLLESASTENEGATSKYLYDSLGRRLVQFTRGTKQKQLDDGDDLFHDDFYLFENGCTNSYQSYMSSGESINDGPLKSNHYESIKLLPANTVLDSHLLLAGADDSLPVINLDHFMNDDCLARLQAKLHYINGLTRLLHLIECRREEFLLQLEHHHSDPTGAAGSSSNKTTQDPGPDQIGAKPMTPEMRGMLSRRYRAGGLQPMAAKLVGARRAISSLDISVTIPIATNEKAASQVDVQEIVSLESGVIPISIVLSFEPAVSILINLFQFESMGLDEHLSESASAHSIYMMPLAHPNLNNILQSVHREGGNHDGFFTGHNDKDSFSFEGTLSGSLLGRLYDDPIELTVSYDAGLMTLASEWRFIDRTDSNGLDGWNSYKVLQLLDGQSSLRFHLMDGNFGYKHMESHVINSINKPPDGKGAGWRSCATNHLTPVESNLLFTTGADLFSLNGAIYMGMAVVRGIPCRVYERRLFRIPAILGLSDQDYSNWLGTSDIYLNLYAYKGASHQQQQQPQQQELKFVRLQIKLVPHTNQNSVGLSFVLDLSSFTWAPRDFIGDGSLSYETLINRMTQDCLLMVPGARHLDLELWFHQTNNTSRSNRAQVSSLSQAGRSSLSTMNKDQARLLRALQTNRELRDHSVIRMLTKTLQISPVQQVDLTSEILASPTESSSPLDNHHSLSGSSVSKLTNADWLLYVKFSLYELWNDFVDSELIGYAVDLSFNSKFATTSKVYGLGARSYSYDECLWRTVHSLQPTSFKSEYGRRDDDDESMVNSLRLFMYCPQRLICILGDSSWHPIRHHRPTRIDNLLEFPYTRKSTSGAETTSTVNGGGSNTSNNSNNNNNNHDDSNKCLVGSVIIRQQSLLSKAAGMNSRRSKLDWWLTNGRHGSQAATAADENLVQLRVRELSFLLKVELTQPTTTAATTTETTGMATVSQSLPSYSYSSSSSLSGDMASGSGSSSNALFASADQTSTSLPMQVSKLRLSNKILIRNAYQNTATNASTSTIDDDEGVSQADSENGAEYDEHSASLLIKPLYGLAYLPGGMVGKPAKSDNNSGPNGNGSSGTIKPLIVSNLAECSRACLLLHGCRSFSACHQPIGAWTPQPSSAGSSAAASSPPGLSGGKISCVFSKLAWSERDEMNQLLRLTRASTSTGRPQQQQQKQQQQHVSMEVKFNELATAGNNNNNSDNRNSSSRRKVVVHFELSPLCSLHARPQLDLFRLRRSSIEVQPKTNYLIYARSVEQCARFCQERAQLVRLISSVDSSGDSSTNTTSRGDANGKQQQVKLGITGASRSAGCYEFYYSADNQYCQLIPKLDLWSALHLDHLIEPKKRSSSARTAATSGQQLASGASQDDDDKLMATIAAKSALVRRWLEWFRARTPHESWLDKLMSVYGETEYYELDFEQVFLAHRNQRLTYTIDGGGQASPSLETDQTMQVQLWHDSATGCAEYCLRRKGCRSFGVQTFQTGGGGSGYGAAIGQGKRALCLLNPISARELASNPSGWPSFKLERTTSDATTTAATKNSTEKTPEMMLTTWWHYEPSELALFMITDPEEPATSLSMSDASGGQAALADEDDDSAGLAALDAGIYIQAAGIAVQ